MVLAITLRPNDTMSLAAACGLFALTFVCAISLPLSVFAAGYCPSGPVYSGQCNYTPSAMPASYGNFDACGLAFSSYTITAGQGASLAWNASVYNDGFLGTYWYQGGYITGISGVVGETGSTWISFPNPGTYSYNFSGTRLSYYSGFFVYSNFSCDAAITVNPSTNPCSLPWGGTISHGSSVTAYQSSSVAYGSSCVSQTRTCDNGNLSGSYAYSSCSVQPPPAPTCSISLSPSAVARGTGATLSWSSSNASTFYISNVGYVSGSGSTTVTPSTSTTYSGSVSGAGGSGSCSNTLTVYQPPTCSVTFDANPVNPGAGTTLRYSSANASTFYVNSVGYVSGSGSIAVAPNSTTNYGGSVSGSGGSATCPATLTVNPPSCTISVSPTSISQGGSATLSWASSNATGGTISGIGTVGTSGSTSVSPSQTTTYSGTFTGPSGSAACTAGASGTMTLSVSCIPSTAYSCSGNNIVRTATASNCSQTVTNPYASCTAPAFCSSGSSVCLYPPPSFNEFGGEFSGHLEAKPQVVPRGGIAAVYWNVSGVSSCTVTGTNGDSWNTTSSGSDGKETSAINQQTVYAMHCSGLDGSDVDETITVNVLPVFIEN